MSLSFAVTRSRFRCVAVLLTIALLTTTISAVPAAHASPDTGLDKSLCNSDASRVTIPDDLPVKACFDGKTLLLENSLPFPIEARTDNGGTPVVSPTTEATLPGAITSLMAPMGDWLPRRLRGQYRVCVRPLRTKGGHPGYHRGDIRRSHDGVGHQRRCHKLKRYVGSRSETTCH